MIVPMRKMTFIGVESDKARFVERLQEVGVVHLVHPKEAVEPQELAKELARVKETHKFLGSRAVQEKTKESLTSQAICANREDLAQREGRLLGEIAALKKEMSLQEVWGDCNVEDLEALGGQGLHVQFFRVSEKAFEALPLKEVYHRVVGVSRGETCFVTASFEPAPLTIPEEKIPSKNLSTIQGELDAKGEELKEIAAEYTRLAAHLETLKRTEAELTDLLEYRRAVLNAGSELGGHLFTIKCWSPLPEEELMKKVGHSFSLYHYSEDPLKGDRVPVLLTNKRALDSGRDLVEVYSYPSYWDFDPSGFVLYFFALFFGLIVGDAGYGLTLLAITVLLSRKVKSQSPFTVRFFRLMYLLSVSVVICGIVSAGYFGIKINPDNPLSKLSLLDFNTKEGQDAGMILSIIIGMIHISLSHLINFKENREYASLGWVVVIWAGFFLVSSEMERGVGNPAATYAMVVGLIAVMIFSSSKKNLLLRILAGLNGLLGIVQIFSDVLSYLRLFALGIATVYMAHTFNMLAGDIVKGLPWIGYIFAVPTLIAGHFVNLMLAVMGGIIHGLRLNFLEWYRWCFVGDGLVYKPFRLRKS
jgi:V/A-type H+-transporting ATPase subunit I